MQLMVSMSHFDVIEQVDIWNFTEWFKENIVKFYFKQMSPIIESLCKKLEIEINFEH